MKLYSAGLFSSSSVLAVVRRLRTLAPSLFCCSSQWTGVSAGASSRNFSSVTAAIRPDLWPWRSHSGPARHLLASAGGSPLRTDTFTAHGSLIRYTKRTNKKIHSLVSLIIFIHALKPHGRLILLLPYVNYSTVHLSTGGHRRECQRLGTVGRRFLLHRWALMAPAPRRNADARLWF